MSAFAIDPRVSAHAAAHPYPLLFATISGAHLYGFPSPDSDWDLRGAHILPLERVAGLEVGPETITTTDESSGLEIDLVTHDVEKFFRLMLKPNGYVLEQLHSPLIVGARPEIEELRDLARGCVTRFHAHHYLGFFHTQWKLFEKESPPRVKPLLYTYRVLMTGIHLMRTGEIEANLGVLNGTDLGLPFIADLISRKTGGAEKSTLSDADMGLHREQVGRLLALLEMERDRSTLPEKASSRAGLHDLLLRLRGVRAA